MRSCWHGQAGNVRWRVRRVRRFSVAAGADAELAEACCLVRAVSIDLHQYCKAEIGSRRSFCGA
ncbi:hypothetical protein GCM10009527_003860 [Actinomadura nitritigenes]